MTPTPEIRVAEIDDSAEIARLSAELGYPVTADEVEARLVTLLGSEHHHVAVAVGPDATLLGWISAEHRLILESGERAEIVGLVVDGSARRSRIGRSLVLAVERWAAARGLPGVVVRSNITRRESHQFHQSNGYVPSKTQHTYVKILTST